MSLSDPIADMLTRIRNALAIKADTVNIRASGICQGLCKVLKDEGYIKDYRKIQDNKQGVLRIYLKYGPSGEKIINRIERVSKPGLRVYSGVDDLPQVLGGLGITIVSTSRGILSNRQCRQHNVGGEVLCSVY